MKTFLEELEELETYPSLVETAISWQDIATKAAVISHGSFTRQYITDEMKGNYLRLSSIGKTPALDLAAHKFNQLPIIPNKISAQQRLLFWTGDAFETWVYFQLCRMGYSVSTQLNVEYYGVPGHIDFLCERDGESFVLETKTANEHYFKQVKEYGVGDERGYLTQLGAYSEALGVPGYWLFVNKNTSELMVIPCEPEQYEPRLKRLRFIVDGLNKLTEFEEAYYYFRPVPPSIELLNKKPAKDENDKPLLYVPSSVPHPSVHYVTEKRKTKYGKPRLYVTGYHPCYADRTDIYQDAIRHAGL